jgi:hypothetical protein
MKCLSPLEKTGEKNLLGNKKSEGKALIPLPPTGFASVFFANLRGVQTKLQPPQSGGLQRRSQAALNARF